MLTTALLACAAPVWAQAPAFATAFTGRTMRVDYFHTLRLGERVVTLDRIVDDGEWAGSRSRLIDDTNLGMYLVEVSDRATNRVLYTRGFSSLANEWETTPAGRHEWRTFHESLRFPWPRGPVQVVLRRRGPDQRFDQIWSVVIDPASRFVNAAPAPPSARTWTLVEHGPASEKVDLLVLGEGYTEAQRPKFHDDVRRLVDELFRYEPFRSRRTDFNVRAIDLPAREPGVHRPQAGAPRRTPLSTEYNIFDSERYLLTQDNRALRDAAAGTPYEFVEILVNESHYGGGGIFNAHATAAADSAEAGYLFVH
jgi:hypothetical protein